MFSTRCAGCAGWTGREKRQSETAMHLSASEGFSELCVLLYEHDPGLIHLRDSWNCTPIMRLCNTPTHARTHALTRAHTLREGGREGVSLSLSLSQLVSVKLQVCLTKRMHACMLFVLRTDLCMCVCMRVCICVCVCVFARVRHGRIGCMIGEHGSSIDQVLLSLPCSICCMLACCHTEGARTHSYQKICAPAATCQMHQANVRGKLKGRLLGSRGGRTRQTRCTSLGRGWKLSASRFALALTCSEHPLAHMLPCHAQTPLVSSIRGSLLSLVASIPAGTGFNSAAVATCHPRLHYRLLTLCPAPTDPVPRGLLTLRARAGMCVCILYVYTSRDPARDRSCEQCCC